MARSHTVAFALAIVCVLIIIAVLFRHYQRCTQMQVDRFDMSDCKVVDKLNCSRKWQCIDGVPMRTATDGTIQYLNGQVWNVSQPNMYANCDAFIATMNNDKLAVDNKVYDNKVTACPAQCTSDTTSSCYHALMSLPKLNNCVPPTSATIS